MAAAAIVRPATSDCVNPIGLTLHVSSGVTVLFSWHKAVLNNVDNIYNNKTYIRTDSDLIIRLTERLYITKKYSSIELFNFPIFKRYNYKIILRYKSAFSN